VFNPPVKGNIVDGYIFPKCPQCGNKAYVSTNPFPKFPQRMGSGAVKGNAGKPSVKEDFQNKQAQLHLERVQQAFKEDVKP